MGKATNSKKSSYGMKAPDKAALRSRLKEQGIQPSAPRMAIARFVLSTMSHPTAEDVRHEVERDFPTVSLATVYNTLNLFVEKGLLKEVRDPERKSIRYDCNIEPHFHFIDDETGEMHDLDSNMLKIQPNLSMLGRDFSISQIEVTLRGRKIRRSPKSLESDH